MSFTARPLFTVDDAVQIARTTYAIDATASELPGHIDQNFLLKGSGGRTYVLKIANTAEVREVLDLRNKTMQHLSAHLPDYAFQEVLTTIDSKTIAEVEDPTGKTHYMRLVSYLNGVPLENFTHHPDDWLYEVGVFLGRMDSALMDFQHEVTQSELRWNISRSADVIRAHLQYLTDDIRRALIERQLHTFEAQVAPHIPTLRQSYIHNDANDTNILMRHLEGLDYCVGGIIDFGDMMYSCTIYELAIALPYVMMGKADPLKTAAEVVRGYNAILPLTELEISLLYHLISARLAVSACISALHTHMEPGNNHGNTHEAAVWQLMERLQQVHPNYAHYIFRNACGLGPVPVAAHIIEALATRTHEIMPVIGFDLHTEPLMVFDLSVGSTGIGMMENTANTAEFTHMIFSKMRQAGVHVGVGRYDEARLIYTEDMFRSDSGERRTIHLGIDLFAPVGTPVYAPLDGVVHSFNDNTASKDYGPTIILEHTFSDSGTVFYTLYGHLTRESLNGLSVGQSVKAGEKIAEIGDFPINGDWPPHLHIQIITDMMGNYGDFPGVGYASQRDVWRSISPDPNLLLGIPEAAFPQREFDQAAILEARRDYLGKSLSVAYHKPIKMVRGIMQYLYDDTGRMYLDAVNNVPLVGHSHPQVVQAAQGQIAVLNTNSRYLHDNLVNYAQRLTAKFPDPLSVCFFVNSGSEANELALRLARTYTGHEDIIVIEHGYHGNTGTLIDISPYKYNGKGGRGRKTWVHEITMPDGYRGKYRYDDPEAGHKYAEEVRDAIARAQIDGRKIAAFIGESWMGSAGQVPMPEGYLSDVYTYVRSAGGVCIADEVQIGFGRVGEDFWGFAQSGVVPDIVTLGKPIGNGHPLGAVITTPEIAEAFANGMEYFNTFGGNPVSCAVGLAVLDIIESEKLTHHATDVGTYFKHNLSDLSKHYPIIGDVRGTGLFLGVELVRDHQTLEPADLETAYIVERMREEGILISIDGPLHNVLKIKPPLPFDKPNADHFVETLARLCDELKAYMR